MISLHIWIYIKDASENDNLRKNTTFMRRDLDMIRVITFPFKVQKQNERNKELLVEITYFPEKRNSLFS